MPGINRQLENILSIEPSLKTMKKLLRNYDWFIGCNKTGLDFIISDDPAKTVWLGFNDICIPVSKKLAIVMRVKLKDAPMISIDKARKKFLCL